MTKTSTSNQFVNFTQNPTDVKAVDEPDQQDELFYNSLKPRLNALIKDPSDETISKILAYAKGK